MISKIGLLAVAGVGVANAILNVYLAVFIALGIGTLSLISHNIGAKQIKKAQIFARQSFNLALFFGVIAFLLPLLKVT